MKVGQAHLASGGRYASLYLEGCNLKGEARLACVKDEIGKEDFNIGFHGNCTKGRIKRWKTRIFCVFFTQCRRLRHV